MPTTYYRLPSGGVARTVEEPGSLSIEVYDRSVGAFVYMPGIYGHINGTGGDGHAEQITEAQAAAIIATPPRPNMLDGPGADGPDYGARPDS